jgi:hypothetical protein
MEFIQKGNPGYNMLMRGWPIVAIIGAALLTTPATAQMRAARSAPGRAGGFYHSPFFASGVGIPNRPPFVYPYHQRVLVTSPWRSYYRGWYYGAYWHPFWWWDTDSSSADNAYYQQYAAQEQMNQLYNEVQRLREQQALATAPPPPQPSAQQQAQTVLPLPTTLVFRDGKTETIQNYAIVGKTLWVFNERQTKKILLSELNIPATRKVNEEHGVEFSVPE